MPLSPSIQSLPAPRVDRVAGVGAGGAVAGGDRQRRAEHERREPAGVAADDVVVAVVAEDLVGALAADDHVVARVAADQVGARRRRAAVVLIDVQANGCRSFGRTAKCTGSSGVSIRAR